MNTDQIGIFIVLDGEEKDQAVEKFMKTITINEEQRINFPSGKEYVAFGSCFRKVKKNEAVPFYSLTIRNGEVVMREFTSNVA